MKAVVVSTFAVFGLSAGLAFAGEGQGNPFEFQAPPAVTHLQGHAMLPSKGQDPFPFRVDDTRYSVDVQTVLIAPSGSQREVESVNSLPPGFEKGTVSFESAKVLFAYRQERARAALAAIAQANVGSNARATEARGPGLMAMAK